MHLRMKFCDLTTGRTVPVSNLAFIVRMEFESVQEMLAAHDYPTFSSESTFRVIFGEAQILSDKSPLRRLRRHPYKATYDQYELTVIYSGTGLGIRTIHWAMSSGDGIKEYGSNAFPYIECSGRTCAESALSYIDRLNDQLSDDESKTQANTHIPLSYSGYVAQAAHRQIRAYRRGYRGAFLRWTSRILSSTKPRPRLHPGRIIDAAEICTENSTAALGLIKFVGGAARTVLDEPLALKATVDYLYEKYSSLVVAVERAMLHSDNPSVHGHMWETTMTPVFAETFKSRPLSSWPLLISTFLPN
ncbi:hypothetical protein EC957_002018 [Mortierella hygrophila]|uniref:Uncharacterized protein n=1 Tax=Mortierella hygrophila TaxID=979708 RepID=A0A9P6K7G0_9FUNG|nr:hypothetical protein EC957_002018 [Mortierella hygrophila]